MEGVVETRVVETLAMPRSEKTPRRRSGEARGCAPLLEMLVTLEEVHRAAERGGADFASLARGPEARGLGVERVVGR